eukprot:7078-Eustigmatos_ZCMA.PRE.1
MRICACAIRNGWKATRTGSNNVAPTLHRCAGRCPPRGRVSPWGGPAAKRGRGQWHPCTPKP